MQGFFYLSLLLGVAFLGASCASGSRNYDAIETGRFEGKMNLNWISPDQFVYVPEKENPFRFVRSNGEVVQPGPMYTDGGSFPQTMRSNPKFSPWGYAPAFLLHDWLFYSASEGLPGPSFDVKENAEILGEGIKTLMEADNGIDKHQRSFNLIYNTVQSPISEYTMYFKPWYRDLPKPEETAAMGAAFYDLPNGQPTMASKIRPDSVDVGAIIEKELPGTKGMKKEFTLRRLIWFGKHSDR